LTRFWIALWLLVAGIATAQEGEYGGPAMLSRGIGPGRRSADELVRMRFYAQINGIYDNGLTAVSTNSNGALQSTDEYGVQGAVGVYGYHQWQHTLLGLNYHGDYNHYTNNTYYDGTDQSLSLGLTHQLSRHLELTMRQLVGTSSRPLFSYYSAGFTDSSVEGIPVNELYDGRTSYSNSMVDLTYQKSARLSFNFGGSGYLVRRRSQALVGLNAASARGDMSYRLSKAQTIGVDYGYSHYDYQRGFGSSDVHTVGLDYAVRLNRSWEFSMQAGGTRVESLGLTQVQIDPAVAAIIGTSSGTEIFYRTNYLPSGRVQLFRSFQHSTASLGYGRTVDPGNGVYLTSRCDSATGNYSYNSTRRWSASVGGSWESYSSLSRTMGKFESYGGSLGGGYRLMGPVHLTARGDYRRYQVSSQSFRRDRISVSMGLTFSPGDVPLSLW
jgi:hypothetical protein